jgi:hypothetical protein
LPLDQRAGRGGGVLRGLRSAEAIQRLALWLFVWTAVVAPALHLVDHHEDHVHGPGGVQRAPAAPPAGAHDHGDGQVHAHAQAHAQADAHGAPGKGAGAPAPRPALPRADADADADAGQPPAPAAPLHGRGAAEHFGLALVDQPAFVPPFTALLAGALAALEAAERLLPAPPRAAHLPRGPPRAGDLLTG